ncbi:hypothetical protein TrLO_g1770 [Triparma laevis f. longispina]|uniref:Uncharacterized protein n=1 Tax=Triparma laevis f. longispina TaxID=1714387 RepID=A0A9W7FTK2_9STRA|nr:hypothetical protein TrLO_g1770 [Triparma laevis f. longispina]
MFHRDVMPSPSDDNEDPPQREGKERADVETGPPAPNPGPVENINPTSSGAPMNINNPASPLAVYKPPSASSPMKSSKNNLGSVGRRLSDRFNILAKKLSILLHIANVALFMGAALSLVDVVCDIIMIREFAGSNQPKSAIATAITVALSLISQLFIVLIQNSKLSKRKILREIMFVLLCVKPGVDVYRVMRKEKRVKNQSFTPHIEMIATRIFELCFESVPGTFIQAMALINGHRSVMATISLISSVLITGFISSAISVEKDISAENRRINPNFYGYIPIYSIRRALASCFTILIMATCQLTSKVFALSLCTTVNQTTTLIYLLTEICVCFAIKIFRQDFIYWIPLDNMTATLLGACLMRLVMKTLNDFTGLLMTRHPYELGGAYWSFTLFTTPLVCLFFGWYYLDYVKDESVQEMLSYTFSSREVYGTILTIIAIQSLSYLVFLNVIDQSYRSSFSSFTTAKQYAKKTFNDAEDLGTKIEVLQNHPSIYYSFKDEIEAWLHDNLPTWIEEKPDWFDDAVMATIPDDLVKSPELLKQIRGGEVVLLQRRRSTMAVRRISQAPP